VTHTLTFTKLGVDISLSHSSVHLIADVSMSTNMKVGIQKMHVYACLFKANP